MKIGNSEYNTENYEYIYDQYDSMGSKELASRMMTGNLLATLSFWLSIAGCICCGITSIISSILAIISLRNEFTSHRVRAKAALIISIISLILHTITLLIAVVGEI